MRPKYWSEKGFCITHKVKKTNSLEKGFKKIKLTDLYKNIIFVKVQYILVFHILDK